MKIISYNVNGIRAALSKGLEEWLQEASPDVLCLQETKVIDNDFPHAAFEALGYHHRLLNGQKMHHGVAMLSKLPLSEDRRHDWQDNGEARHIGARLPNGLLIENVYVPAGGDIPDTAKNPKFAQKLAFIERMTRWSETLREPTLIVGDFNIAPLECDVYDHKALLKVVSHTPVEVAALGRLADAHGWVDLGRKHIPAPERNWTWWSYRTYWQEKDRGRRLDHMWASPDLAAQSTGHRFVEETRRWEQPSDHVPLITEFAL